MPTLSKIKSLKGFEDASIELTYSAMAALATESSDTDGFKIGTSDLGVIEYYDGSGWIVAQDSNLILGTANETINGTIITEKIRFTPEADDNGVVSLFDVQAASSNNGAWDVLSSSLTLKANLKAVDDAPLMSSTDADIAIEENDLNGILYTAQATDIDSSVKYSLIGADAKLFKIDSKSGAVTLKKALDYEKPADANQDNVYEFDVVASSGKLKDSASLTVSVTDTRENSTLFKADSSGNFAYVGGGSLVIEDIGWNYHSSYTAYGTTYETTMTGTYEKGFTTTSNGYTSTSSGFNFPDIKIPAIWANDVLGLFDSYTSNYSYDSQYGSGSSTWEYTLITNRGAFTSDGNGVYEIFIA